MVAESWVGRLCLERLRKTTKKSVGIFVVLLRSETATSFNAKQERYP